MNESPIKDSVADLSRRICAESQNLHDLVSWLEYGKNSGYVASRQSKRQEERWADQLRQLLSSNSSAPMSQAKLEDTFIELIKQTSFERVLIALASVTEWLKTYKGNSPYLQGLSQHQTLPAVALLLEGTHRAFRIC
jgi:hypothetical protein